MDSARTTPDPSGGEASARTGGVPFFVVGSSRSGTTMFRLMLNAHPRLLIPSETWFLKDLLDRLPLTGRLSPEQVEEAVSIVLDHWRWKEWHIENHLLEQAVRDLDEPSLRDVIQTIYSLPLEESGKDRWGDKTPGYVHDIKRLHHVLPEAKFLHVIRDGRDVCLSLKKTGWHGETAGEIARYWRNEVLSGCDDGRALPEDRYLEVIYEELVLETEKVLRKVCDFLDEDFHPQMLTFFQTAADNTPDRAHSHLSKTHRAPQSGDVGRWRREMKSHQVLIFEAFAGDALDAAGYDRCHTAGLPVVRGAFQSLEWVASKSLRIRRRIGLHFPGLKKKL